MTKAGGLTCVCWSCYVCYSCCANSKADYSRKCGQTMVESTEEMTSAGHVTTQESLVCPSSVCQIMQPPWCPFWHAAWQQLMVWKPTNAETVVPFCKNAKRSVLSSLDSIFMIIMVVLCFELHLWTKLSHSLLTKTRQVMTAHLQESRQHHQSTRSTASNFLCHRLDWCSTGMPHLLAAIMQASGQHIHCCQSCFRAKSSGKSNFTCWRYAVKPGWLSHVNSSVSCCAACRHNSN